MKQSEGATDVRKLNRLCLAFGAFLAAGELYKQCFLYFVIHPGIYDWWDLPFQLCSMPLYLCFLVPVVPKRQRSVFLTFLMDYNLMGAVMAFADISGMVREHWSLTLHSVLWHVAVILLGICIGRSGQGDVSRGGYARATVLLLFFCAGAELLNVVLHNKGIVNLFYISPYYRMGQMVFRDIAARWGNGMGIVSYIGGMCLGGALLHEMWYLYIRYSAPCAGRGNL